MFGWWVFQIWSQPNIIFLLVFSFFLLPFRLCLREYCIEILNSAYNGLVHQVRRLLQRTSSSNSHDDSYLLWIVRFLMEFNRLYNMKLELVR